MCHVLQVILVCVCVCIDTTYGRVPDKSCFMKVFNILLEFTNSSSISSHPLNMLTKRQTNKSTDRQTDKQINVLVLSFVLFENSVPIEQTLIESLLHIWTRLGRLSRDKQVCDMHGQHA